jgi:hypothetical protein
LIKNAGADALRVTGHVLPVIDRTYDRVGVSVTNDPGPLKRGHLLTVEAPVGSDVLDYFDPTVPRLTTCGEECGQPQWGERSQAPLSCPTSPRAIGNRCCRRDQDTDVRSAWIHRVN